MTLPLPAPQDYTDKDFEAVRARLAVLIVAAFPDWSDTERSRFENVLLDAFAFMMDVLAYYLDNMARQTRWGTVTMRYAMIELARLIGYSLDTNTASTADVIFSIPAATAGLVTIPAGTTNKTLGTASDVIRFQSQAVATIAVGLTDSLAVISEHSKAEAESYTAVGEIGEEFVLESTPFLDLSDSMTIAAIGWTRVEHFLDSGPADLHYTIRVDENDKAKVKVGDGVNGATAAVGGAVEIAYKSGGGPDGDVDATALQRVEGGPWYDALGNRVTLTCNNAAAASGGDSRESVAEAKVRAPRSIRVLNRCIARTDWSDLAIQVAGVGRALALTSNEMVGVPEGQVWLYIIREDLTFPVPAATLTAVETYITTNYPTPAVCTWDARTTPTVSVDVAVFVYLESGAVGATVAGLIRTALQALFDPVDASGDENEDIDFGYNMKDAAGAYEGEWSLDQFDTTIKTVSGIRRLGTTADGEGMTINAVEDNLSLNENEWPIRGNLTVTDGDTAAVHYNGPI